MGKWIVVAAVVILVVGLSVAGAGVAVVCVDDRPTPTPEGAPWLVYLPLVQGERVRATPTPVCP